MADQCYHNGDFYQALEATAAGESPTTHPDKWAKIRIPAKFRWVLARLTHAHLLELDGQMDKAMAVRANAIGAQRVGLDDLIREEANRDEASRGRPNVHITTSVRMTC